jgi:hypothetical protein
MSENNCKCTKERKPRKWKCGDLTRIARYSKDLDCDKRQQVVEVASALGFGWIFCIFADFVKSYSLVLAVLARIGGVLVVAQVIEALLALLGGKKIPKITLLLRLPLVVFVIVLTGLDNIIGAIATLYSRYGELQVLADLMDDLCSRALSIGESTVDNVGDLIGKIQDL